MPLGNGSLVGVPGSPASAGNTPLIPGPGRGGAPDLQRQHSDETTVSSNLSGYTYRSSKSTQEIIDSLHPGTKQPLTVNANGTVVQSNTRIMILQQRGVDVINLPIIIATRLLAKLPWPAGSRERMHGNYYGNVNISSDKKITILEAEDDGFL